MLRTALAILVSTLVVSLCSGCTLVGLGIGAAIPRKTTYGEESPAGPALVRAAADEKLEEGDHVVVTLRPEPAPVESAPVDERADIGPPPPPKHSTKVVGDYRSIRQGILALDGDDYYAQVPLDRIDKARVSHGSYWLTGMLAGLSVDAIVATTITVAFLSAVGGIR